jgi:hypothetical protein
MSREDPVSGKSVVWTFDDGQMAGRTFTHTFHPDGSLEFEMGAGGSGKSTRVDRYEVARLNDDITVVSYLSPHQYTLTVALDFSTGTMVAFSSSAERMDMQRGRFIVQEAEEQPSAH